MVSLSKTTRMSSVNFEHLLESNLVIKQVKKGEILIAAGQSTVYTYYVNAGCLRSYTIDDKGKEHILQFAPEDWIISNNDAFDKNELSRLNIDAVEESTVYMIIRNRAIELVDMDQALLIAFNNKLQRHITTLQKRILMLISATAEERYAEFNRMYPNLVNRIPQKMIASYLGITPEGLSRVRKLRVKDVSDIS